MSLGARTLGPWRMTTGSTPQVSGAEELAAVRGEPPTTAERLHEFAKMLRRRARLIAMVVLLTTAAALAVSLSSPDQYDATSKLLLRDSEPIDALLDRPSGTGAVDPERETNTKVALIKLEAVADRVVKRRRLNASAGDLLDKVDAEVEGNSDIVTITVRDEDPRQAAGIANGFAQEYVAFRRESARASLDEAAELARNRLASLDDEARASAEGRQLEARLRELEIASSLQTGGAEIVREASIPTSVASPRPFRAGLLGVFFGLVLGVGAAALAEFLDRRLRDEAHAQAVFELPLLATVPKPLRQSDAVILNGDREIEEAYGTLAANVLFANRARKLEVLMITSARSGDGKTSATFGLARALRTLGQRVIVVEADLHHPRFVHVWNIEQRGGLSSLLAGVADLSSELVALDNSGEKRATNGKPGSASFAVLPAGPVPPNASAMLSRPIMGEILQECRELADVVLIDTAPVGLVHDPLMLVNHVDGVLLVARLQHTTKDAARQTLRLLGQVGSRILGVVVTGGERMPGYYGDADYRHYGRPQSQSKAGRPESAPKAKTSS